MKKFLSPKILIPVVVALLLLGMVGYILLAPSTWWKPFYVKMEMAGAASSTGEAQAAESSHAAPEAQAAAAPAADSSHGAAVPAAAPGGAAARSPLQPPGIMYKLDSKVVNLAEPGGLRYLQADIVLELWPLNSAYYTLEGEELKVAQEEFNHLIDSRRPIIDDIVTSILSSKTFNEIATIEGKSGLKQELTSAINGALGYQGVINVYFTSFVVQ
jgi:flagellar FliL protein